ncbi:MAG: hypothetical protein JSV24_04160 [Bacteroidales bacterium]|nr:MAG: hypothetical protein JSV24_04160 [Bacteroidales bacterium]
MKHFPWMVFILLSIVSCQKRPDSVQIMTVNGPVEASEMGITLVHEHVIVDWIGADSTGYHRWDRDEVVGRALPFLLEIRESGVNTFLECTPAYLGRDPFVLKELSEKSGIAILTNTGYYGALSNRFIPAHAFEESPEALAQRWVDEFENGIDGSGVRPGFIKIAVNPADSLSALHQKIIHAASIAHKKTGLAIVSHTGPDGPAFAQIGILKTQGVSPTAFIWTHAQGGTLEGCIKAAQEGAWISLDNVNDAPPAEPGMPGAVEWYANRISDLKDAGLLQKILISHDSGWYNVGQPDGGNYNGYTVIFNRLLPELKKRGFTDDDIEQILVRNPREAFTIRIRYL